MGGGGNSNGGGGGGGAIWVFMEQMRERFWGHDCFERRRREARRGNILIGLNELGASGEEPPDCRVYLLPSRSRARLAVIL